MVIITALIPLLARLGMWYLEKTISDQAKRAALNRQWLDTIHSIAVGVEESAILGKKYNDARAKLDAKFNEMKGKQNG
jgi:hypothetical protein